MLDSIAKDAADRFSRTGGPKGIAEIVRAEKEAIRWFLKEVNSISDATGDPKWFVIEKLRGEYGI